MRIQHKRCRFVKIPESNGISGPHTYNRPASNTPGSSTPTSRLQDGVLVIRVKFDRDTLTDSINIAVMN